METFWLVRVVCVGFMGWLAAGTSLLLGQMIEIPGPNSSSQQPTATAPPATAVDPSPQEGVLLLRNGEVLQGKIVQVGDFYYVAVANGQVRIRSAEVEIACRTLQEGYQFKRQNIRLPSAQEHLSLGQWCIRHGLVEEAQRELAEAVRLQPDHPLVPLLRRRIEIARQPGLLPSSANADGLSKGDSLELESWVRSLPPAVVEQFTQSVQPILLNSCTAAGCHGPSEKSRFSLLKPPSGQSATRRLTQRNLASTFQWVNTKDPLRSPLLTAPLGPHGSAKTPIFGNPQSEAYQRMVRWTLLAAGAGSAAEAIVKTPPFQGSVSPAGATPVSRSGKLAEPKSSPGEVIPAVAVEETPQVVHQAGVWQPVPGALPSKGPLAEALASPPNGSAQGGSIPSAFLPWAVAPNAATMPPAGSARGVPDVPNPSPTGQPFSEHYPISNIPAASHNPSSGQPGALDGSPKGSSPTPHRAGIGADVVPEGAAEVLPEGSAPAPPGGSTIYASAFPSPVRSRFSPPYRSQPQRGDPTAGQFRPVDPFDPELFNRRHPPAQPSP